MTGWAGKEEKPEGSSRDTITTTTKALLAVEVAYARRRGTRRSGESVKGRGGEGKGKGER